MSYIREEKLPPRIPYSALFLGLGVFVYFWNAGRTRVVRFSVNFSIPPELYVSHHDSFHQNVASSFIIVRQGLLYW